MKIKCNINDIQNTTNTGYTLYPVKDISGGIRPGVLPRPGLTGIFASNSKKSNQNHSL